jgi:hypothetical protein
MTLRSRVILASVLLAAGACHARAQEAGAVPRYEPLAGSRDRPGLFTQRLTLPARSCGPVHIHNSDLHGLVLRGTLLFGIADTTGRIEVHAYPAGSFVPVAAGERHVEGSMEETEIHLSGIGPLQTTVLEPADPSRCEATTDR